MFQIERKFEGVDDFFRYAVIWERERAVKEIKSYVLEKVKDEMGKYFLGGKTIWNLMRILDPLRVFDKVVDGILNPIIKKYAESSIEQISLIAEYVIGNGNEEVVWRKYLDIEVLLQICELDKKIERAIRRKYEDEKKMLVRIWDYFRNLNEERLMKLISDMRRGNGIIEMYEEFIRDSYLKGCSCIEDAKKLFCASVMSGSSTLENVIKKGRFSLKKELKSGFLTIDKLVKEIVSWYILTIIDSFKEYTRKRADEIFTAFLPQDIQ